MLVNGVDHEDEIAIVRAQLMAWCHCFEAHKHEGAHKTGCKIKGDNITLIGTVLNNYYYFFFTFH